jgi:hypothetical protein
VSYANNHPPNTRLSHVMTRTPPGTFPAAPEPPSPRLVRAVTFAAVLAAVSVGVMSAAGAVAAVRYVTG